jgi:hypothetical protein
MSPTGKFIRFIISGRLDGHEGIGRHLGGRQSDLVEGVDSNGHPTLTSIPSNASGNHPYPPWRSNYRGDYRDLPEQPLCTRDLLCWAFQIARGMDYLARRKVFKKNRSPS